jgi:hypothetical protein
MPVDDGLISDLAGGVWVANAVRRGRCLSAVVLLVPPVEADACRRRPAQPIRAAGPGYQFAHLLRRPLLDGVLFIGVRGTPTYGIRSFGFGRAVTDRHPPRRTAGYLNHGRWHRLLSWPFVAEASAVKRSRTARRRRPPCAVVAALRDACWHGTVLAPSMWRGLDARRANGTGSGPISTALA